jgi:hypothetical protein
VTQEACERAQEVFSPLIVSIGCAFLPSLALYLRRVSGPVRRTSDRSICANGVSINVGYYSWI